MALAIQKFTDAISSGDLSHDGDPVLSQHIKNAVKRSTNIKDDNLRSMHVIQKEFSGSARKIDGAAAAVLSWEARMDALASGVKPQRAYRMWGTK